MEAKYLNNIHNDLLELSNIDLQKQYWLDGNEEHVSSYSELMCRLFDDDCFDEFVETIRNKGTSNTKAVSELIALHENLNLYDENGKTDQDILSDPIWIDITEDTKKIIELWSELVLLA